MTGQNSTITSEYVFDNDGSHSTDQHRYLAELLDPLTSERLGQTGVTDGWNCLEVGAGGGSVALWLAERVAPTGRVLATDIKPGLIPIRPGLTVARHDIVNDPLPSGTFDLIHARLVLSHLPERQRVLERLHAALRPGGWLQIDEVDISNWSPLVTPDRRGRELYETYTAAMARVLGSAGSDPTWGGSVAQAMSEAGLVDIDPACRIEVWGPGSAGIGLLTSNSLHLEEHFLRAGMTRPQLADVRAVMADPVFRAASFAVHSVLARRPGAG
ncbi:ubiquinone/menaquinone biosynthesis C-methylase UbiE [Streptosporangium album]|uniref:Ubiquinone/menaquinone biosynthesis C-methylase UbiE n=1 Tax=Streptosporangium album TaxID=47479 RepID=A0A7W7W8W8_9ACTN|nr:class I SAM-dependent methyltransferase [Streptosporangium album]MBB4938206.1 ubiquinone/menaquinone biosynthesis C-methylase UbiE [Streptosporangium album]